MNWWQLLVLCVVLCAAIVWLGQRLVKGLGDQIAAMRGEIDYGFSRLVKELGAIDIETEQVEYLKGMDESLRALTKTVGDPDVAAQLVRLVRDSIKRTDEAEQNRAASEQERQKEHDAWARAAREEAERLSNRQPKKGDRE